MPDLALVRAYLDANILFSASYSTRNRFLQFWNMEAVKPVTSRYAIGEIRPHLLRPGHADRLDSLLAATELVPDRNVRLISNLDLVEKDKPILAAAIGAKVDYLVTGDRNHFGHLYHTRIDGVYVTSPAEFLNLYADRLFD